MKCDTEKKTVTARAPATIGNCAVGFDILGCAISGVFDTVTLTLRDDDQIIITDIEGLVDSELSYDPRLNLATSVMMSIIADKQLSCGFDVSLVKGIPLASGLGGSAASIIASLIAFNAFLKPALTDEVLLQYAMEAEGHADNVAPSLLGGMTLVSSDSPLSILPLPVLDLILVVVTPAIQLETQVSRQQLQSDVALSQMVKQSADLAAVIAALYLNDIDLFCQHLNDRIIGPQRHSNVLGYHKVEQAALDAGALTVALSGAGPTMFAITTSQQAAKAIEQAMLTAFNEVGLSANSWLSFISSDGATVVEEVSCNI